jgi:Sec-independent protein translocase protein TatA
MTVPPRHLFSRIILLGIAILCPSQCRISISGGGGGCGSGSVESALSVSAFSPSPPSHHHHGYASRRQPHQRHYAGCYYHSSYPIHQLPVFHNHHSTSLIRRNHIISSSSTTTKTTSTCLHSFFGLGPAEIAIVALASLVVIGPSKLLDFSKEAGNIAGKTAAAGMGVGEEWSEELKSIPEEFRKGVELGEIEARSRKAKVMENADMDDSRDDDGV